METAPPHLLYPVACTRPSMHEASSAVEPPWALPHWCSHPLNNLQAGGVPMVGREEEHPSPWCCGREILASGLAMGRSPGSSLGYPWCSPKQTSRHSGKGSNARAKPTGSDAPGAPPRSSANLWNRALRTSHLTGPWAVSVQILAPPPPLALCLQTSSRFSPVLPWELKTANSSTTAAHPTPTLSARGQSCS